MYIWGGVGIGKTWIMDFFFQSINNQRKLRLHLYHFIDYIHEKLFKLQGQKDPLLILADKLKRKIDIICIDEFFISDITDAVLLSNIIEAILKKGIILVTTSNVSPDNLYKHGLQRNLFIPFIKQIKKFCNIINMDNNIDYRIKKINLLKIWHYPLNNKTFLKMNYTFKLLTKGKNQDKSIIEINYRTLQTRGVVKDILAIDFCVLCGENRSKYDYIELSKKFNKILLFDVPIMTDEIENYIRRFIILIDELYDRHVKLIVSAETSLFKIYKGTILSVEYQRCFSRLQEMQSMDYFNLPNLF